MVSHERLFEKLRRMESKILAYHLMIDSGVIPKVNSIIRFEEVRLGEPALEHEIVRAKQAMFDIKADIEITLEKLDIPWKDYIKTYHTKDGKKTQLGTVLDNIGKEEAEDAKA